MINLHPVIPQLKATAYSALIISLVSFGIALAALSIALVLLTGEVHRG